MTHSLASFGALASPRSPRSPPSRCAFFPSFASICSLASVGALCSSRSPSPSPTIQSQAQCTDGVNWLQLSRLERDMSCLCVCKFVPRKARISSPQCARAPHRSTAAAFCVQQWVPACAPCAHCEHCSCVPSVRTPRTRAHTDLLLLFATLVLLSLGPRTWGGGTFPINQNPRPERRSRKWVKKERGPFTTGS